MIANRGRYTGDGLRNFGQAIVGGDRLTFAWHEISLGRGLFF